MQGFSLIQLLEKTEVLFRILIQRMTINPESLLLLSSKTSNQRELEKPSSQLDFILQFYTFVFQVLCFIRMISLHRAPMRRQDYL